MGIVSQLPSFHLFIHRVLTKLSDEVLPHGVNYCQLQLLFVWLYTDRLSLRILQAVDATHAGLAGGFGVRFLSRTLPSRYRGEQLGRVLDCDLEYAC